MAQSRRLAMMSRQPLSTTEAVALPLALIALFKLVTRTSPVRVSVGEAFIAVPSFNRAAFFHLTPGTELPFPTLAKREFVLLECDARRNMGGPEV